MTTTAKERVLEDTTWGLCREVVGEHGKICNQTAIALKWSDAKTHALPVCLGHVTRDLVPLNKVSIAMQDTLARKVDEMADLEASEARQSKDVHRAAIAYGMRKSANLLRGVST